MRKEEQDYGLSIGYCVDILPFKARSSFTLYKIIIMQIEHLFQLNAIPSSVLCGNSLKILELRLFLIFLSLL